MAASPVEAIHGAAACGLMTAIGGFGHTLPYLIADVHTATWIAVAIVLLELAVISWVRHRFMDTPWSSAAVQVVLGGLLVFAVGILIGSSYDPEPAISVRLSLFQLAVENRHLLQFCRSMAAIGRFQKGDECFYAKVVDGELFRLRGDVFGSPSFDRKPTPLKGVRTLTPVMPSKIIAIGLNYADHAREQSKPLPKEPLFWIKATTSLIPDGGKIEIPFPNHRTDFEAELCIVMGRRVRNVTPAAAARYILGYTSAQDISDRTIQNGESQWTRAKSFDTFTPLGPYVETKIDPHALTIQLFQNGQLRQNSNTNQLIFNCYQIVSFVSTNMTLLPGDVILTGTPSGVGPIQSGDQLEVRIQGLTPLVNTVK